MGAHIVLNQAREQGLSDAQAHGPGREIDVVGILGARGIGLRPAKAAEILELLAALPAGEILDGVVGGAGMRLDRHPVGRVQHVEIERGHDGRQRGRRGLVAAHLQPVFVGTQVVGVVDRPARQPAHPALDICQQFNAVGHVIPSTSWA
jgi:hypothetical protein